MYARVARWVGWELLLALLPLLLAFGLRYYRDERPPSLGSTLGTGQALLIAVAWAGTSLREMREAPPRRAGRRELVTVASSCYVLVSATMYGFVTADVLAGRVQTENQAKAVAIVSVVMLGLTGFTTAYAVAVGTPEREGARWTPRPC